MALSATPIAGHRSVRVAATSDIANKTEAADQAIGEAAKDSCLIEWVKQAANAFMGLGLLPVAAVALRGRYGDTTGRPYIEAVVIVERFGIRAHLSCCIDTGADQTLLLPMDSVRLGVDYSSLKVGDDSAGSGGRCKTYSEPATLVFCEAGRTFYYYDIDLEIAAPRRDMGDFPSLLGRDVLDRWRRVVNPSRTQVYAKVITADDIQAVPSRMARGLARTCAHH